MKHAVIF